MPGGNPDRGPNRPAQVTDHGLLLVLLAGQGVVGAHAVHLVGGTLSREVALALLGDDVNHHGPHSLCGLDLCRMPATQCQPGSRQGRRRGSVLVICGEAQALLIEALLPPLLNWWAAQVTPSDVTCQCWQPPALKVWPGCSPLTRVFA